MFPPLSEQQCSGCRYYRPELDYAPQGVATAIDAAPHDEDRHQWDEARALIREVAASLRERAKSLGGRCHRYPPQIGPRGGQWPEVDAAAWCGEWCSREVK